MTDAPLGNDAPNRRFPCTDVRGFNTMKLHPSDPRHLAFKAELDALWPNISADLSLVATLPADAADRIVEAILRRGCQAQNDCNIRLGREAAAEVPRDWILDRVEVIAERVLNLEDEWEYRRLLELYGGLDEGLVRRLVARGRLSDVPEIREAAEDY